MPSCPSARKWRERRTTASVRRAVGGAGRRHRISGQRRDASCTRSVLGCRSRGEPTLVEPILEDTWSSLLIQIDLSCDHVRNAEQEEEEEESARDQEINNGVRSPTKALTLHHPLHTSPREYFNSVSIYEEHTCVCVWKRIRFFVRSSLGVWFEATRFNRVPFQPRNGLITTRYYLCQDTFTNRRWLPRETIDPSALSLLLCV